MSGAMSRNKGANFERKIAKIFAGAFNLTFRRTPLSGGWSKDADVAAGDLVCVDGDFEFCIEIKCQEGWKFESLLTDQHAWIDAWWRQVIEECPKGKVPLLVFSKNYTPIFAAFSTEYNIDVPHTITNVDGARIVVCLLEHFLELRKREATD